MFTVFYFIVITLVTVGYGDIRPMENFSRLFMIAVVVFMLIFVSKQSSDLTALFKLDTRYKVPYAAGNQQQHVVLIGKIYYPALLRFLSEFYSPDHASKEQYDIVILSDEPPSRVGLFHHLVA